MENTVNQILDVFQQFRMAPTPIDQYDNVGKAVLANRIDEFVRHNKRIEFVMLGYPMKSANNRDKVIGDKPDLAEELSIQNFGRFQQAVSELYQPGIKMNIVNDGFVFNDLLGVKDNVVYEYQEITEDMARAVPMEIFNLNDFMRGGTMSDKRDALMENFNINDIELERRIQFDPDVNFLYRGMIRFMEEELAIKEFVSGNQKHKAAKTLTKHMMLRNEAYSSFVSKNFSEFIRLSMHPSVNNGNKFSFQLIPGPKSRYSPWHCAIAVDNGEFITIHKKDAEAAGMELVYKEGRPYNFITK